MRTLVVVSAILMVHCIAPWGLVLRSSATAAPQDSPAQQVSPAEAARVRSQIRAVEEILPRTPERGAALFLLAQMYSRIGELRKTLALLEECVALDQGFDPGAAPRFRALEGNPRFRELLEKVRVNYLPVSHAQVSFTVAESDLFPEGISVDTEKRVFYMGSMHRKKIVKITASGEVTDFVKTDSYDLPPVGGTRVDLRNHDVWAASDPGVKNRSELLHFNEQGKLLERFAAPGRGLHDLNDLVLRGEDEVYTTDTDGNVVFRFDRKTHRFSPLRLHRAIFYPNGITLSGDAERLYFGDLLGVVVVDLRTGESRDVIPDAHDTLAGIDGLYWYKSDLSGVQYGTAAFRIMRWHLAKDGQSVESSEVLERGTEMVKDPTTAAIFEGKLYYMANTGIDNLQNDRIVDASRLEPVKIAVLALE